LITELRQEVGSKYKNTFYKYDEAGNRISKTVYEYQGSSISQDTTSESDFPNSSDWQLYNKEIYSRDVSGRELAIYVNDEISEYPIYGLSLIGKIKNDVPYYYYKDHLGSVRAVVNSSNSLISAQDYACPPWRDAWGYLLDGRSYQSDESKFKFTGKERDKESNYDYFGARYYDARIGRWGQVEPLLDKYPQISPYNYSIDNPLNIIDPNGKDPYRSQLGSPKDVLNILQKNVGKTFGEISDVFNESQVRFIYTEKGGFIDLVHFFAAADISQSMTFNDAIFGGETVEFIQGMMGNESADDPEDRPSNWEGAKFGKENSSEMGVVENFKIYLEEQEILDPTDPKIASDKIYIPYDNRDKRLPERKSYKPYRGESLNEDDIKDQGKY